MYIDPHRMLNIQNNIYIQQQMDSFQIYKAYIPKGNNDVLIRTCLKKRFWWSLIEKNNKKTNLIWTEIKQRNFYKQKDKKSEKKLEINEEEEEVKQKDEKSQKIYEKNIKKEETFKIKKENQENIKIQIKNLTGNINLKFPVFYKYYQIPNEDFFMEKNIKINQKKAQKINLHNHLENNFLLANKKNLLKTLKKFYSLKQENPFDFIPLSFCIKNGQKKNEFQSFQKYFNTQKGKNIWIVKPGESSNKGNGIKISQKLEEIEKIIGKNEYKGSLIIQKYIEKPLLYEKESLIQDVIYQQLILIMYGRVIGFKKDIQGLLLKNSILKILKINQFIQRMKRFKKILKALGNLKMETKFHLMIQTIILKKHYKKQDVFYENIYPNLKKIAKDCIEALFIENYTLNSKNKKVILFGLDFIIDSQYKPWLLEINSNPSLSICCHLQSKLIPLLIENVFQIAIDPLFPPPGDINSFMKKENIIVSLYEFNKFEIVFDQNTYGELLIQKYSQGILFKIKKSIFYIIIFRFLVIKQLTRKQKQIFILIKQYENIYYILLQQISQFLIFNNFFNKIFFLL
ncbi:tubulin-tyrosine ligase family protein, putative [Ichthyophthirius multifiliis]|uniref:Tubulin-tyrosine ligase family protein, putative n=1 Tax=Ichthyophthirius multifiliis TaxID=5932 RepID=G0QYZ7_ICHMU|nr:tubulin-tyrosine ligase family protein, putative [Ichthyophthirius multifiliis]EGR29568.1 tubulin-tyrosine ligase family protein, putative [Ichthyophthirius multifiliis]|eukprot:XP_004030804.1 tubulin-tyrosine ligase family protein, putative [Ichthyophthirius multifiliis]